MKWNARVNPRSRSQIFVQRDSCSESVVWALPHHREEQPCSLRQFRLRWSLAKRLLGEVTTLDSQLPFEECYQYLTNSSRKAQPTLVLFTISLLSVERVRSTSSRAGMAAGKSQLARGEDRRTQIQTRHGCSG